LSLNKKMSTSSQNISFSGVSKPSGTFSNVTSTNATLKRLRVKESAQLYDVQVDGSLNVKELITVGTTLHVTGRTTLDENLVVNGNTRLGNQTTDLIGFYTTSGATQATTSGSAATFVVNSGTAVNTGSTFDGYTVGQVVKSLRNTGLLA
jgi:hypothetical protein